MVTPSTARSELDRFVAELIQQGLAIDSNAAVIRHSGNHTCVTWSSAPIDTAPFSRTGGVFATAAEYRALLDNRQYNCLLFDASCLQASYEFHHGELQRYRFCYYPCPVRLPPEELWPDIAVADLFDEYLILTLETLDWLQLVQDPARTARRDAAVAHADEPPRLRMRSPVRFDYDTEVQRPGHPASHVHISEADCRVPVYAPLSFGHFARFVFRHFYTSAWEDHDFLRYWHAEPLARSITSTEETDLYLECRRHTAQ